MGTHFPCLSRLRRLALGKAGRHRPGRAPSGYRDVSPNPQASACDEIRARYRRRMGLLTPVAIRIGGISWMPRLLPGIVWVDTRLQRLTRGRLTLLDIAGLPNLMLTVPGRKSGIPRSTPLLCVPHQGTYLVAG